MNLSRTRASRLNGSSGGGEKFRVLVDVADDFDGQFLVRIVIAEHDVFAVKFSVSGSVARRVPTGQDVTTGGA